MSLQNLIFCPLALLFALGAEPASACTLWAAVGDAVAGGSLIAKNRDWRPDHRQEIRRVHARSGHDYIGLYAVEGSDPGLKAGTNDQGLTVVSASASSLSHASRAVQPGKKGVMRQILERYADVDGVLADAGRIFPGGRAGFLMISDRHGAATVEIGLDGRYALRRTEGGTISHTNHYLDAALQDLDQLPAISSRVRLARVEELLRGAASFDLERFVAISGDRHDGPDNSLWRSGREHTLASWIVRTPEHGAPTLYAVLANPGEPVLTRQFVLDESFWQSATLP